MKSKADIVEKITKILRLARGAGTAEESHAALAHAQRLMYHHGIEEREVVESVPDEGIVEVITDSLGRRVSWREYLGAVIAENFQCAYIISVNRSSGLVRLVFVGRRDDAAIAHEAYQSSSVAAQNLSDDYARSQPNAALARSSFLTGFIKGLYDRFQENVTGQALMLVTDDAVMNHARALAAGGDATGGYLAQGDPKAVEQGYESGYSFGSGKRSLRD